MHPSSGTLLLAAASAAAFALTGCQPTSACGPVGVTSGEIVRTANSAAYQGQVTSQNGAGLAHLACRAEATIDAIVRPTVDPQKDSSKDFYSPKTDPHLHVGAETTATQQGQYRVLGVGRGTDEEDCGKTAMQACNDAVDDYYRRARAVRAPDVKCQLNANQDHCAASAK